MTEVKNEADWSKIKRMRFMVNVSNLIVVPWFFIGLVVSQQSVFLAFWILLYLVISKSFMYMKIKALKCPNCGGQFLDNGFSIAFAKKCCQCGIKIE